MTAAAASVDGHEAARLELHVPTVGPWWADVDLVDDAELSGEVRLEAGDLELVGTVAKGGAFGSQRRVRVVAGGAGWGTLLAPKAYHSDSGINPRLVAEDAARGAGETLGDFGAGEGLGRDYVRQAGPASRVLEDVAGGVPWWVDYDGVTHVASREDTTAAEDAYEVLDYHPRDRTVRLTVDDLRQVGVGALLSRMDDPQRVRELRVTIEPNTVDVVAWVGDPAGARGRLVGLMRGIARRSSMDRLWGKWRYRVVRMSGDRVELQAVTAESGLPDILPVDMWPGVAGVWADMTPGTEVLVEFVEGLRSQPVITGFAPKGGPGFVPVALTIGDAGSAKEAARNGDAVKVTIPSGTFLTSADNGTLNPDPVEVDGTIEEGSGLVKIA